MKPRRAAQLAASLLAMAAAPAAAQYAGWWRSQWQFRRIVAVADPPTKLPGDDAAVVQFPTHGALAPDGRDVRVLIANRREVPCRVLQVGPGDLCRVVFAVAPNVQEYAIYYGNPEAVAAEGEWLPQRGCLLESRKWPGGDLGRLDRVRATMTTRAADLLGRDYVQNIFWGVNPFADTGDECNHFLGYLIVPAGGLYQFATTSDDASFLTVDGHAVVQWPGRHAARRDARFTGEVQLTAGLHKIEYFHVNVGDRGAAVAAWKPPTAARIKPIPPDDFAPVFQATLGRLDEAGRPRTADFLFRHDGEAMLAGRYVQRFAFQANAPPATRPQWVRWDFGDGNTAVGLEVRHVFLTDGPRTVRMDLEYGRTSYTISNRIDVQRDWTRQAEQHRIAPAILAGELAGYDWAKMSGADLRAAIDLFQTMEQDEQLLAVCEAVLASPTSEESARAEAALLAAELTVTRHGDPAAAVALLADAGQKTVEPARLARLRLARAGILIEQVRDAAALDAAEGLLQTVLADAQVRDQTLRRRALCGLGDLWRQRGDGDKARDGYTQAEQIPLFDRTHTQDVVRIGSLARYVEEYVRSGAWADAEHFLDAWEWEYPLQRLAGYSTLLRVRMALRRDKPARAADLAAETVNANPQSPYADQLLTAAADACDRLGQPDRAAEALRRLIADYPESPLAGQAAARLAAP